MTLLQIFHHRGRTLELIASEESSKEPVTKTALRAPGAGNISIGPISLIPAEAAPGQELSLSSRVSGEHIRFVYVELLLCGQEDRFFGPVYREHILASHEKTAGGVRFPDWEASFAVVRKLKPVLRLLTDGSQASAFGFMFPEKYAPSAKNIYRLNGLYTLSGEDGQRRASLYFDKTGRMTKAISFGQAGLGAIHALTPRPGDQFTPQVKVLREAVEQGGRWTETTGLTNTLTFPQGGLRWEEEKTLPGDYLAGLLVEDLDGKFHRKYAPLKIIGGGEERI